ncbi:MAG: hypothetical protein OXJ62_04660 [Spirochaetaceae bacterium]|nr:hypothetical protein [Spirochaetaceae bacterium]
MLTVATAGLAQTQAVVAEGPSATGVFGLNLFGPLVGIYSGSLEVALDEDWSLFVVPTYFNAKGSLLGALFEIAGVEPEDYELWSISGALGANYFLTDRAPVGLFVGGSVEPGYLYATFKDSALEDEDADNLEVNTFKIGGGVHVGYRVLLGPVAITPRAGLAYHYLDTDADGISGDLERTASAAFSGFSFGWGLDLGIAF